MEKELFNETLPIEKKMIVGLMKRISLNTRLWKQYTARCVRTTIVTQLYNSNDILFCDLQ